MTTKYEDTKYMRMPFGKYKKRWLSEIPDEYIKWGIQNFNYVMAETFAIEWQRRYPKYRKKS